MGTGATNQRRRRTHDPGRRAHMRRYTPARSHPAARRGPSTLGSLPGRHQPQPALPDRAAEHVDARPAVRESRTHQWCAPRPRQRRPRQASRSRTRAGREASGSHLPTDPGRQRPTRRGLPVAARCHLGRPGDPRGRPCSGTGRAAGAFRGPRRAGAAHPSQRLTHGPTEDADPAADQVRARSFRLVSELVTRAHDTLTALQAAWQTTPPSDEDVARAREATSILDVAMNELYFASGAYDRESSPTSPPRALLPIHRRFYREADDLLDQMAEVPWPSVTHHLVETLEFFIPLDPRGVFLRLDRAVAQGGQQGGYQLERLAVDLIVRLIRRYLADHRDLLHQDPDCRRALRTSWTSSSRSDGRKLESSPTNSTTSSDEQHIANGAHRQPHRLIHHGDSAGINDPAATAHLGSGNAGNSHPRWPRAEATHNHGSVAGSGGTRTSVSCAVSLSSFPTRASPSNRPEACRARPPASR
jgi:hypothetical protein